MDVTERHSSGGGMAAVVMVVGGVAGTIGAFLTWASVQVNRGPGGVRSRFGGQGGSGGRSFFVHGPDTASGRVVLALFIALIVVALFAWLTPKFWLQLGATGLALVLGLISLVMTITVLVSPESLFGVVGTRLSIARIPVSIGAGLWLALSGGVVAVSAAFVWLAGHRRAWLGPPGAPAAEEPTKVLAPSTQPELAPE